MYVTASHNPPEYNGLKALMEDGSEATRDIEERIEEIAPELVEIAESPEELMNDEMEEIVKEQLAAGADICKVVTTARKLKDNIAVLQLITDFPEVKIVSFAMGAAGRISRILCTLAGGYFTYASIKKGRESADGQTTAAELRGFYRILGNI